MAAKNVTPLHPVRDPDPFAEMVQSIARLAAQCAVCASAAWAISEDCEGNRPKQAMANMPVMLDQNKGSNTTIELGRGADYTLARLRRDRPDLAERVKAGELSANAAAIQAGFRSRTLNLPLNPET
jgi:hypothetical protein